MRRPSLKQKTLSLLAAVLGFTCFSSAIAQPPLSSAANNPMLNQVVLKDETEFDRFRVIISPEYTTISNKGQSLTGIGVQGAFMAGLTEKWQLGLGFRQSFSGNGLANLFSEIDIRNSLALTGSTVMHRRRIDINGVETYNSSVYGEGGLRLDLYLAQYFFNLESSVLPLSGVGGGLHYEFPSESSLGFLAGIRIDYVTSGTLTVYPIQIFAGINLWI